MKNKYAHISNLAQLDQELLKLEIKKGILITELKAVQVDIQSSFSFGKVASDILSQGLFYRDRLNVFLLFRIGMLLFKSFRTGGGWTWRLLRKFPF